MDRDTLLKRLAPCGLVCHTCAGAKDGLVEQHGRALRELLEGFDSYAAKFSAHEERLKKYPAFREVLELICEARCEGCRAGTCKFPGCEIAPCAKEKGHDFCFQCESFPCDEADFEPLLKTRWLEANMRMKEVGAKRYLEEVAAISHYV
jgi:hypothetical protein